MRLPAPGSHRQQQGQQRDAGGGGRSDAARGRQRCRIDRCALDGGVPLPGCVIKRSSLGGRSFGRGSIGGHSTGGRGVLGAGPRCGRRRRRVAAVPVAGGGAPCGTRAEHAVLVPAHRQRGTEDDRDQHPRERGECGQRVQHSPHPPKRSRSFFETPVDRRAFRARASAFGRPPAAGAASTCGIPTRSTFRVDGRACTKASLDTKPVHALTGDARWCGCAAARDHALPTRTKRSTWASTMGGQFRHRPPRPLPTAPHVRSSGERGRCPPRR